ncbi:MAG: hypothetical protein IT381_07740 [Deltaproteobacteria bacterium]|nr:hypothetical protein [Deltaproteobacteria bacterium]
MIAFLSLVLLAGPASFPASAPVSERAVLEAAPASQPVFVRRVLREEPPEPSATVPFMRDVRIDVGYKNTIVPSQSFRALNPGNVQAQSAIGVSWAAFSWDRFALAPGVRWEASLAYGNLRGDRSRHATHRALLSLDARYRPLRWLDVYARAAGGVFINELAVSSAALPSMPLVGRQATGTLDGSLGVDFLLGPHKKLKTRAPRVWATLEAGYSWTAPMALVLAPSLANDDPRRAGTTTLGTLNIQGPFLRMGLILAL